MADIVYVALHGMNGEDGRVQATFDMLGIPYTGSGYLGAAIAMDKMLTKEMIKDKGVRTPDWKTFHAGAITSDEDLKQTAGKIASEIEAPCVVKTPTGGSSVGVYIVTSQDAVRPAVEKCLSFGPDILVEQMIEGREFTCAVLGDRALPSVEIVPKVDFYNYRCCCTRGWLWCRCHRYIRYLFLKSHLPCNCIHFCSRFISPDCNLNISAKDRINIKLCNLMGCCI
jgi:D-alanine-D-alanine ligase